MKRHYYKCLLTLLLALCAGTVWAQNRAVSGRVTDSGDGSPLPGVSVAVKGTTTGTTSDANGKYTLGSVPDNATLVFSFIGFTSQERAVGGQSAIDIKLISDVKALQEVVVTAIGIQRDKKALGYAVSTVKGEDLQQRSESDPIRGLTAKVPGVNIVSGGGAPGQATKINIRGNSSLTGNTQPLFVVDGIPFDNSTNGGGPGDFASNTAISNRAYDIDPNNIASMTVLKGAAAAALYGSRATNGVVVITTKSGSKNLKKGMEVNYASSYSNEKISSVPDYQDKYTQGSNQNYNGGFIGNWGAAFPDYVDQLNEQLGVKYYTKTYSLFRNGPNKGKPFQDGFAENPLALRNANFCQLYPDLCDADGNGLPYEIKAHDNIGGFFKTGHLIENSVNISSTGEKTSLNAGVSRMTNQGIVENLKSSRTTLNFGGSATLANNLTINGGVQYINTTQDSPPLGAGFYTDYGGFGNEGSIYGRLYYLPRNFDLNGLPFEDPVTGNNLFYRPLDNPRWSTKYSRFNSNVNRAVGNLALSYNVTPWLNLMLKGGVNTYAEKRKNTTRKGGVAIPLGAITTTDLTYTEQDYNFIATANKSLGENFDLVALLGVNANERVRNRKDVRGVNIIQPGFDYTATQLDYTFNSTGYPSYRETRRLLGFFGDVSMSYKKTYFLGLVARNDNASTLPKNNRSYFYSGANASVVFTDALNIPANILNFGKVRLAYTKVGREADPYQLNTTYSLGPAYTNFAGGTFFNASLGNTLNNPNLKPESTVEFEAGTELQFFQNRINLDFTYFDRNSFDQVVTRTIAGSSGFSNQVINSGQIRNSGIEIGLNVVPVRLANGFEWNSFFAFTRIRSVIVDDGVGGGGVDEKGNVNGGIFLGGTGLVTLGTMHVTGQPYGMIFGTKNARDANGNLLINEGTGLPFQLPKSQLIGNPQPDFTLGWTNSFSWKGFTVSALLDWRQGGQMFSSTAGSLLLRGQLKVSEDNREGVKIVPGVYGNTSTFEPILGGDGQPIKNTTGVTAFDYTFTDGFGAYGQNEVNVYDVTTIRLREATLGYSLPKTLLSKTPFGAVRLSLSGRNLWFRAPNMLKGLNFDPEVLGTFPDSNIQGFDLGATPSTRRYGVNLSLTF